MSRRVHSRQCRYNGMGCGVRIVRWIGGDCTMNKKPKTVNLPEKSDGFATFFTSKKGKRFYAKDYGHKVWPIGKRGKK
jgi:hypothetical protein